MDHSGRKDGGVVTVLVLHRLRTVARVSKGVSRLVAENGDAGASGLRMLSKSGGGAVSCLDGVTFLGLERRHSHINGREDALQERHLVRPTE